MESDKEFYALFSKAPETFFELIGEKVTNRRSYTMKSETLKEIARTTDGFFETKNEKDPVYFVEFQARYDADIYHRIVFEMASYGSNNPQRDVRGVIIFTLPSFDPKTLPWYSTTQIPDSHFRVFYLKDIVERLEKENRR